jgi:hypothetical protein
MVSPSEDLKNGRYDQLMNDNILWRSFKSGDSDNKTIFLSQEARIYNFLESKNVNQLDVVSFIKDLQLYSGRDY